MSTMLTSAQAFLHTSFLAILVQGGPVKAALASDPQLTVVVNADGQVLHSTVVDILDELRLAGVSGLAIAVKSGKKPSG